MHTPTVSIITRTRSRERFLPRAAASVLGQSGAPAWEWIIVNDGGAPEPVEAALAAAVAAHPGRVRILHLPQPMGMEHASNHGIAQSGGRLIAIHDDDDSWTPEFLATMAAFLDDPAHAGYAGAVCHSVRVEEEITDAGIVIRGESPFNAWLERIELWRVLEENPYPPISFLFRRSAYDEAGPFDESLPVLGDWEFNVRVLLRHPIGVVPRPLARYHHRPANAAGAAANTVTAGHDLHRKWEQALRARWLAAPPPGLPEFGRLAAIAGHAADMRRRMAGLLSLPLRPGPQV